MLWTMRAVVVVVVAASLVAITSATDSDSTVVETKITDQLDSEILGTEGKIITLGQPDVGSAAVVKAAIITAVILGVILLFREFFLALGAKLYPEEVYDTYSYYNRKDAYYNHPSSYDYYDGWSSPRSLANNESFFSRVLNSIDPVESAFAMLQVEELACRRRTVCELQKAASRMPILGSLLQYVSSSIRGLEVYREAQEAGAALEDCALLFSECPTTLTPAL